MHYRILKINVSRDNPACRPLFISSFISQEKDRKSTQNLSKTCHWKLIYVIWSYSTWARRQVSTWTREHESKQGTLVREHTSTQATLARKHVITQGTLPRDQVSTQGTLSREHVSTQGTLAREHVSTRGTLASEHVDTQRTLACGHVSTQFSSFKILLRLNYSKSSHRRFNMEKDVLGNSGKFIGKHLCQRLFFNKVAGWGLQLY